MILVIALVARTKRSRLGVGAGALTAAVLLSLLLVNAPGRRAELRRRVFSVYDPGAAFERFSLSNIVPEGDQLSAIFTLMPAIDSLFSAKQARELKRLSRNLYDEMERDVDFHSLGSNMQAAYNDLLGWPEEPQHAFVYVPVGIDRGRHHPVLVFFHGSGGNFKAYTWILSKLADQLNLVIVAPSGGAGNWDLENSQRCLDFSLTLAEGIMPIDRDMIFVMGLSSGGKAVSQLAQQRGSRIRSLVYVSPVFDASAIDSLAFANECQGHSALVISGDRDDRVPVSYVEGFAKKMTGAGLSVEMKTVAGADHFLMFSHREELLRTLSSHFASEISKIHRTGDAGK